MANAKTHGVAYFKVAGDVLSINGAWTLNAGEPRYEEQIGSDGSVYYKVVYQVAMAEGELFVNGDPSVISRLAQEDPQTVTMSFQDGSTFVMSEAVWAGSGNMNSEEGTYEGKFIGESGKWLPR